MTTSDANKNTTTTIPLNNTSLVVLNPTSIKLTGTNFPTWKVQMTSLLIGYGLQGYTDGSFLCPLQTDPGYVHWIRQDQLIINGIISSVADTLVSLLGSVTSSKQAWDILVKAFANKSRSRILTLKERLTGIQKGDQSASIFLQQVRSIADELAIIGSPLDETDIVIHIMNGLGPDYKELAAAIRARESDISFDDLYDKVIDHETYLKKMLRTDVTIPTALVTHRARWNNPRQAASRNQNNQQGLLPSPVGARFIKSPGLSQSHNQGYYQSIICQYCEKPGHTARKCYRLHGRPTNRNPTANFTQRNPTIDSDMWIVDSGASHHITNDLHNLSLATPYEGSDKLVVGNGSGLPITNTGEGCRVEGSSDAGQMRQ